MSDTMPCRFACGLTVDMIAQLSTIELGKLIAAIVEHIKFYGLVIIESVDEEGTLWWRTDNKDDYIILSSFLNGYTKGLGFNSEGKRTK